MSLADYTENKFLDHLTSKLSYTMPAVWIGLSTANPGDNAAGLAEPVAMNYARVATVGGSGAGYTWASAANGSITNAAAITFAAASGTWGTITHFALFDAVTTGNMLAYGALTQAKSIVSGDVPKFAIGAIVITMD